MADDVKKIIEEATEGLRKDIREVGVKVEAVQSDMKQVLEGVEVANDRLDRLEELPEKVDAIQDDVEAMKVTMDTMKQDIGSIKHDLKQKVDRDEFSAVDTRVGSLETKLHPA